MSSFCFVQLFITESKGLTHLDKVAFPEFTITSQEAVSHAEHWTLRHGWDSLTQNTLRLLSPGTETRQPVQCCEILRHDQGWREVEIEAWGGLQSQWQSLQYNHYNHLTSDPVKCGDDDSWKEWRRELQWQCSNSFCFIGPSVIDFD